MKQTYVSCEARFSDINKHGHYTQVAGTATRVAQRGLFWTAVQGFYDSISRSGGPHPYWVVSGPFGQTRLHQTDTPTVDDWWGTCPSVVWALPDPKWVTQKETTKQYIDKS